MTEFMKKVRAGVIVLFSLFFISCASSRVESVCPEIIYNEDIPESRLSSGDFVFIRLYDVKYNRFFRPGNFLRLPIKILGKAFDGNVYNHSAISTYLSDDSFIGLSLSKEKNMARYESVLNLSSNDFMATTNGNESYCTVIAVPCAESERKYIGEILDYAGSKDSFFVYGILKNASTAVYHLYNINAYEHSRNFPIVFSFGPLPLEKSPEDFFGENNEFVCSNFISYILAHGVERYRVDFLVNGIDFMGFTPVDLSYLDGAIFLFECNFQDYDSAVDGFVQRYPDFKKYIR